MTSKRGKKGQFFIIGAVILGIIILGIAGVWNASLKPVDLGESRFQSICQNYRHEVSQVSKYAVETENKSGESELIKNFTMQFLNYTKTSEPNFKLLYVYGNSSYVAILNSTNEEIRIFDGNGNRRCNSWSKENGYAYCVISESVSKINISSEKINKLYEINQDERFYFIALEEKGGERYVCE